MHTATFAKPILVTVAAAAIILALPRPSHAACPALPDVEWWQSSHQQITKYVEKRHNGDWSKYVKKWAKYGQRMQDIQERGSSAVVKSRDLRLEGKALEKYVSQIKARVSVLRCLAAEAKADTGEDVANFPTAAGGGDLIALAKPRRRGDTPDYAVEIKSRCEGDNAIFEVVNRGKNWPSAAAIGVYRTGEVGLVEKQVRRLAKDQTINLRIAPEQGRATQRFAVWVQPSWLLRDFKFDAQITCN